MNCFDDLCRLCAGKVDKILSFNVLASDQQHLLKKLLLCLPILISERDNYPKFICMDCAFKLDMVFEFRERCLLTAQLFHEMISNEDVENVLAIQDATCHESGHDQENSSDAAKPLPILDVLDVVESTVVEDISGIHPSMHPSTSDFHIKTDAVCNNEISDMSEIHSKTDGNSNINAAEVTLQETQDSQEERPPVSVKLKPEKGADRKQKCSECGKVCQSNYKLLEHMRRHTGEKPFSCSHVDCKKTFRSKIGLSQHEASHSGQFELSCSTCGKGFQCKSYLKVHQRVHSDEKPYPCHQCSRSFKTKQSLMDHINRHLGVKPYLCDICGRGFITKGLCKSHQKTHSGQDNRQYPCHVCRKLFVSKSYLRTHFHIHTGEKPFMCEVCGKGFLTRVDLKVHSTMHTGEKSFVCETCGKAFARRDALRCHRRSHTGERPYKCDYCGQSFSQYSPMAIHKRLHTGERPYPCQDCAKAFVSRSTLLAHRRKNHETESPIDEELIVVKKTSSTIKIP